MDYKLIDNIEVEGIGVGIIIYKWLTDHEEVEPHEIIGL